MGGPGRKGQADERLNERPDGKSEEKPDEGGVRGDEVRGEAERTALDQGKCTGIPSSLALQISEGVSLTGAGCHFIRQGVNLQPSPFALHSSLIVLVDFSRLSISQILPTTASMASSPLHTHLRMNLMAVKRSISATMHGLSEAHMTLIARAWIPSRARKWMLSRAS